MQQIERADPPPLPNVVAYAIPIDGVEVVTRDLIRAADWMVVLATVSGFCVVSWFVLLWSNKIFGGFDLTEQRRMLLAAVLHAGIYLLTLAVAFRVGRLLKIAAVSTPVMLVLDGIAGTGLLLMSFLPLCVGDSKGGNQGVSVAVLCLAFSLLAVTTYRHVLLYFRLAGNCQVIGHPISGFAFTALGMSKAIFEGIWLTCCATILGFAVLRPLTLTTGAQPFIVVYVLAVAALAGCFLHIIFWSWSIIAHIRYAVILRQEID